MVSFQGHDASHDTYCSRISEENNQVSREKISNRDSSSSSDVRMVTTTKLNGITELASKKHALSERKRRKRINAHYDSLRKFFPRLLKEDQKSMENKLIMNMLQNDKASVLTETVRHLKELRSMVADVTLLHDNADKMSRQSFFIPSDKDEVNVNYYNSGNKIAVEATICCEERPELNQELNEAIHSVHGNTVKAEMATVGGRTKVQVTMEWPECREEDVGKLKRTLKAVMENRVLCWNARLS